MRIVPKHQEGSNIQKSRKETDPIEELLKNLPPALQMKILKQIAASKKVQATPQTPYRTTRDTKNGVTRITEEGGHPDSNTQRDDSFWEQFINQNGDSIVSALYPQGLGNGIIIEGDPDIYRILGDRYYGR